MDGRAVNAGWRRLGAAGAVALFGAAPFVVFQSLMEDAIESDFRLELWYLVSGWGPFFLMTLGTLCFVPVALSIRRTGYSRLYLRPVTRHAWEAWGLVLSLLGLILAIQTAQIAGLY